MIAIFRTSPPTKENRRHGLTQFLVKMKQPGIQVNPIGQITGQYEFNEVVFTDYFVPDDHVLGEIDGAWKQATSELAYERSRPRAFPRNLLRADRTGPRGRQQPGYPQRRRHRPAGGAGAHHAAHVGLGRRHAAGRQGAGGGSLHRRRTSARCGSSNCRTACATSPPSSRKPPPTARRWKINSSFAIKTAPKLTIQGGTTEVLRGIIARGLGCASARPGCANSTRKPHEQIH
mgnify:CR=1 FL=1